MATILIPMEEMDDIMKIVKYPEDSGLLIKFVTETNERNGFLNPILLGNMLPGKAMNWLSDGIIWDSNSVIQDGDGVFESNQNF